MQDEAEKLMQMRRLNFLMMKLNMMRPVSAQILEHDLYTPKILERLETKKKLASQLSAETSRFETRKLETRNSMKLRWDHPLWRRRAPVLARRLVQAYLRTCPVRTGDRPGGQGASSSGPPVHLYRLALPSALPPLLCPPFRGQLPPVVLMASPSRDGEFIAEVARGLGFTVALGSRRKGGVQALRQLADCFRQGYSCGLIADGSRGPARVAQKGPLYLARDDPGPHRAPGGGRQPQEDLSDLGPL